MKKRADEGDVKTFFIKAENDGGSVEEFEIQASINSSPAHLKYRFFRGDTEITEEVGTGDYAIDLKPKKVVRLRVRIKVKSSTQLLHQDEVSLVDPSGPDYDAVGYNVDVG